MKKMLEEQKTASGELLSNMKEGQERWNDPRYMDYLETLEKGEKGSSNKDEGDIDLNALSRAELVTHIQETLKSPMIDVGKKMDEQIGVMEKTLSRLTYKMDVEMMKIRSSDFATAMDTEEGKTRFLTISDKNKEWNSSDIWEDMQKEDIVTAKREADIKEATAKEELTAFGEKPGSAASIAEEKNLSDDEITGRAYDAAVGKTEESSLDGEKVGVILPMDDK